MSTREPMACLALQRFGLGARPADGVRPGDLEAIRDDPRGRVAAELDGAAPAPAGLPGLADLVMHKLRWEEHLASLTKRRPATAAADMPTQPMPTQSMPGESMSAQSMQGQSRPGPDRASDAAELPPNVFRLPEGRFYDQEVEARLRILAQPVIGLPERLVWFWSNHFAVGISKGGWQRITAGAFEREVVRPNVLGRFADMLKASTGHYAMLTYLDNNNSIGPRSAAAKGIAAEGRNGLNENLAREILELHTLGVDGGYRQSDVENLAKMLTGWTVGDARRGDIAGSFVFDPAAHEPGPKILLGRSYPEDGAREALSALDDLAARPATAHFIAFKLARHFVADQPPEPLVRHLADTFRRTDGDLRAVSRALVASDLAWGPMEKLRTPQEFLGAALRGTRVSIPARTYTQFLRSLAHRVWDVPGPNGFPDIGAAWLSPANFRARFEVAAAVSERERTGLKPEDLGTAIVGANLTRETREALRACPDQREAVAVLLLSPEFQRR